jgi:3-oxoacyl-[acyl-carrier-protein] synthase-3
MRAKITSIGVYAPERRMTNEEVATMVDTSDEWIFSHTGIRNRHIAAESQAASDLGLLAARQALDRSGVSAEAIDLILVATSTPDFEGFPSTASIIQDQLGSHHAGAMDLVAACTGFIYGLATARAFVESGSAKNVMVIGTEVFSRIVDWTDRSTCVLFGDGAGAAVVTQANGQSEGVIEDTFVRSRGNGAHTLSRPVGGSRAPFIPGESDFKDTRVFMDGRRVYLFAVGAITDVINHLLEQNNLTIDDIDHIVPHQANLRILEAACKRGNFPKEKFFTNLDEYANTSAASIPIALNEMVESGRLTSGDRVITVGFGAGLTYGGNLIRW